MQRDATRIESGIAQSMHNSPALAAAAKKGLLDFLRQQVVKAEWNIARAKAEITAYQTAIRMIEKPAVKRKR